MEISFVQLGSVFLSIFHLVSLSHTLSLSHTHTPPHTHPHTHTFPSITTPALPSSLLAHHHTTVTLLSCFTPLTLWHWLQEILTQLRTIFDLIIQFETAQDSFYQAANEELESRNHFDQQRKQRTEQVHPLLWMCLYSGWGWGWG